MASIGGELGIPFADRLKRVVDLVRRQYRLPDGLDARKAAIRVHQHAALIRAEGDAFLGMMRDQWFDALCTLSPEALRSHVTRLWLDIDPVPPYWRVVGSGTSVRVESPYDNPALKAFMTEPALLTKGGNTIISLVAGGLKVLKMRIKFESTPMASNIKFSGEV
jgi:hypothetical protein